MKAPVAWLEAVGVIGPGLADWPATRATLAGERPWQAAATAIPPLEVLPPAERRRTGKVVKLALATGLQALAAAGARAADLATVFASSGGDGDNCHAICEALASNDRLISPTRFHNSVNNAASGYWGIATGSMTPSSIVSAYDGSFAAGLLEAVAMAAVEARPVLLVAYDLPYSEPLASARPLGEAFAVALLLAPQRSAASLAGLGLTVAPAAATRLANPAVEALRTSTPAARCLPLLAAVGAGGAGEVVLEYLEELSLTVKVTA